MANIIIQNGVRKAETEPILKSYGVERKDNPMREAAEIVAARTNEAVNMANNRRRYF